VSEASPKHTLSADKTRSEGVQIEARPCAYCHGLFTPARPSQVFCSAAHRSAYHIDHGTEGRVASVRRTVRGASVVVHFSGPAAEAALQLMLGEVVRAVKTP
jgi:cell fate (sporulation/competence/biofilm development) regulator YlbF (YheA/YmcA/DUF963 family)